MLKLKKLLRNLSDVVVRGSREVEITGLSANSKLIAPGNLFVAKKGLTVDGAFYISEAVNAGAVAVLSNLYDPFLPPCITQLIHPRVAEIEAKFAATYFDFPSEKLFLTGVTGTNGKTTTSFLIRHLLSKEEHSCGLIGTIEWVLGNKIQPALLTTPDVITNYRLLREMLTGGCEAAVMEVSSHALDQGRVQGLGFDVAIFTNLTQDHLDYHKTMEDYAAAKKKLFSSLKRDSITLFNSDSLAWEFMKADCKAQILTYGIHNEADLRAEKIVLGARGTTFTVSYREKQYPFSTRLIGGYNIYNALAAIGAAMIYGLSIEEIQSKLSSFMQVPGRLERVENSKDLSIFVDYAHTDDALQNVLKTLKELKQGRLIVVFGCGGDRDRNKRPKMGYVATSLADITVITSDNPRSEDPHAIIADIITGCTKTSQCIIEPDRKIAIEKAISLAQPGDLVLIAGKGHERQQILGSKQLAFDDREIARAVVGMTNARSSRLSS